MMKRFFSVALASCFLTLTACSNDDLNLNGNEVVEQAFNQKYPKANAKWEMERGYFKAEFYENNVEKEAWFTAAGEWLFTSWDIAPANLPVKVMESVLKMGFTLTNIDDADVIEFKDGQTYYEVEIEKAEFDKDFYFTSEGIQVKNPLVSGI